MRSTFGRNSGSGLWSQSRTRWGRSPPQRSVLETSLRLMARAIQERGDKTLARRVETLAVEHGVESDLHKFLERHRLLVPDA